MKILLVDDDDQVASLVTTTLTGQGYTVEVATDGMVGWDLVNASPYDLVLLDVMLPRLDGISFCRRLRGQKKTVPVILLTARDTSFDKMTGLDAGADDYLVKPLDLQELTARIRALLRRGSAYSPVLQWGQLQLNPSTLEVKYGNRPISLRRKEFAILELLLRNGQRVFSRSAILDQLWSLEDAPTEETIKAHIKAIRRQLRSVGAEDLIETLYGQGYRLNPLHANSKSNSSSSTSDTPDKSGRVQATQSAVVKIWQQTKGVSFERLAIVEEAVQALQEGCLDLSLQQRAEQSAHKLHGSLGMFGLSQGSYLARQLEVLLGSEIATDAKQVVTLRSLVLALRQCLETSETTISSAASPMAELLADPSEESADSEASWPLLLIIESDQTLNQQLVAEAAHYSLRTAIAADLAQARQQIQHSPPDVILLSLALQAGERGLALLEELSAYRSQIPVLVMAEGDCYTDRVAVARLGGQIFLQKPLNPNDVMQAVSHVLHQFRKPNVRILAVDDDSQTLLVLKALLEVWGMQIILLENPMQLWDALKTHQPDLLILDLEMPGVSGIDLCQAIRSDPRWNWLPVLVLTAHTDTETMCRVYEVGADDYITKPVIPPELINRILNRLERTRLLRTQAETEPITGVTNRHRSTQELEKLLELAKRVGQPVCLAVLEVDRLKQINHLYSHEAGEKALRQVGQLLKHRLRLGDVVAHWGGAEFVIGIYGMTRSDGVEWLAQILEGLRALPLTLYQTEPFWVTYSGGVVQYPSDGHDIQMLYRNADAVLHHARESGGDRVLPFGWQPPIEPISQTDVALIYPETILAEDIASALETRGYHHQWFRDPEKARKALTGDSPPLRATILLIGGMTDEDSVNLLRFLISKGLKQSRMIVLLSNTQVAESCLQVGAVDYVLVPCPISVILQSVRNALGL